MTDPAIAVMSNETDLSNSSLIPSAFPIRSS